jgi:hypothetical protein
MPKFSWPTAVISGGRDLTTPPAVAEQVASLIPAGTLVRLPSTGHSAIDFRERAGLAVAKAVTAGATESLADLAPTLDELPSGAGMRVLVGLISVLARVESALPAVVPKVVARVAGSTS